MGKDHDLLTSDVLADPEREMEILDLPNQDIDSGEIKVARRVFIRSSYRKLLSFLLERDNDSNILLGSPGIGKIHFVIVFAYMLIQRRIPFVLDSDDKENFFLVKPDG